MPAFSVVLVPAFSPRLHAFTDQVEGVLSSEEGGSLTLLAERARDLLR